MAHAAMMSVPFLDVGIAIGAGLRFGVAGYVGGFLSNQWNPTKVGLSSVKLLKASPKTVNSFRCSPSQSRFLL